MSLTEFNMCTMLYMLLYSTVQITMVMNMAQYKQYTIWEIDIKPVLGEKSD